MKKHSSFWIFLSYLACYKFSILLFFLFVGIFACVFSLYSLEPEPVIYSAVLCLALGITLFLLRFPSYLRLHKKLNVIRGSILLTVNQLPPPASLIEKDYQELVLSLNNLYSRKITAENMEKTDLLSRYGHYCPYPSFKPYVRY